MQLKELLVADTPFIPQLPVQAISEQLFVLRLDGIHPNISGNKWFKLKYNILEAQRQEKTTLLSFGGAYSNHLYALAAACNELGWQCIAFVRGEEHLPLNPTLAYLDAVGAEIHYLSREEYRKKNEISFLQSLQTEFPNAYIIPEGGSNNLAVQGSAAILNTMPIPLNDAIIVTAMGTGATAAGLLFSKKIYKELWIVPVLKGKWITSEIEQWKERVKDDFPNQQCMPYQILENYHWGGYAKYNQELIDYCKSIFDKHQLPLEQVYTGKVLYAIEQEIAKGTLSSQQKIVMIHSGGLQGAVPELKTYYSG